MAQKLRLTNSRISEITEEEEHPDGTVVIRVSDIREKLLRAGAVGE